LAPVFNPHPVRLFHSFENTGQCMKDALNLFLSCAIACLALPTHKSKRVEDEMMFLRQRSPKACIVHQLKRETLIPFGSHLVQWKHTLVKIRVHCVPACSRWRHCFFLQHEILCQGCVMTRLGV